MKYLLCLIVLTLGSTTRAAEFRTQNNVDYAIVFDPELGNDRRDELWTEITTLARGQGSGYLQSNGVDQMTANLTTHVADRIRALDGVDSVRARQPAELRPFEVWLSKTAAENERADTAARILQLAGYDGATNFKYRENHALISVDLTASMAQFVARLPTVQKVNAEAQFHTCAPKFDSTGE